LSSGDFSNSGTIKSTGTGGLLLATDVNNAGGTIAADGVGTVTVAYGISQGLVEAQIAGANIALQNSFLVNGTVSTVVGSAIPALAQTFDTITGTVNNLGTIAVADSANLAVAGQFNNTSVIQLNSTNDATILRVEQTGLTLSGGGKLTLTNNSHNSIISTGSPATLTNVNNTISGAGTIGDANLTLVNDGTISATGTGANKLIIDTGPQTIQNNGKISDTTSAGLTIESNVTNAGSITASGPGALLIDDATVTGGIISALAAGSHIDLGAGQLEQANISTVAGSMIDTVAGTTGNEIKGNIGNAGSIVVNNNSQLSLSGPVNNAGTISLNASSNNTTTLAINNVVLTGHGKVTLTDNAANLIDSGASGSFTNLDNTISGAGTIGDASMTLTNSVNGVINANGTNALHLNAGLLVNSGLIESTKTGGLVIGPGNNAVNNGTIAAPVGVIDVQSVLSGTGPAKISGTAQIKFEAANTQQNVVFAAGTGEELSLTNSQTFSGNISGFTGTDSIDLGDISFAAGTTTATYIANSNLGGTLVITDGTHTTDLSMIGTYSQASFNIQSDGHSGTLLLDPPVDTANHTIASGATVTIATAGLGTDTFTGKGGTLVLDLASDFAGKISGFGGQDRIDLADIGFGAQTTLGYSANANGGGTLTVSDATHIAKVALLGNYIASSFAVASDGHGGTFLEAAASTPGQNALALPHAWALTSDRR
jgi:hypothetical protein